MSLQLYLAFVAACVALALLPGPMVTLVIANGLRHGTRAALINVAGAQVGLAIVIGIVAVGLTSLMATMGDWFDWVRSAVSSCKGCWCCFPTRRCWCSSARSFRSSWI
jgi:threonine/homoserine/homoserine lactone efflux protein